MRLILAAVLAFAGASSASAQAVQDRYGPPRSRTASPVVVASLAPKPYEGRLLSWTGKAAAPPEAAAPVAEAPAFQPPAPAPQPVPRPVAMAPTRPVFAPQSAPEPAPKAPPARFERPLAAAAPIAPAPIMPAQAAPAPATPPRAGGTPRYYSLHREYGRAPDAIPAQGSQPHYVLIGPPDAPSAKDVDGGEAPQSSGMF
jgi:hypothetical protein